MVAGMDRFENTLWICYQEYYQYSIGISPGPDMSVNHNLNGHNVAFTFVRSINSSVSLVIQNWRYPLDLHNRLQSLANAEDTSNASALESSSATPRASNNVIRMT